MRRTAVAVAVVLVLALVTGGCGGSGGGSFELDSSLVSRLRAIADDGERRGNRPDVFAKLGDSNTFERAAFVPLGCGGYDGPHTDVVAVFTRRAVQGGHTGCPSNSFTRASSAAIPAWGVRRLLDVDATRGCAPVDCELAAIRPASAFLMIGSNDAAEPAARRSFRRNLTELTRRIVSAGAIPVLSTLPPRERFAGAADALSEVVREVAAAERVPLWDVRRVLDDEHLRDGLHLTAEGHEIRNRGAVEVLDALWRMVLDPQVRR